MEKTALKASEFINALPDPAQVRFPANSGLSAGVRVEFLMHTADMLERLDRIAAQWEANPADRGAADAAQRVLHSIKGDASFVGLSDVQSVFHQAEAALAEADAQAPPPTDMLLAVGDWLRAVIEHLSVKPAKPPAPTPPAPEKRPATACHPLRILIVEDDFVSRRLLQGLLAPYGGCSIAVDGQEAIDAFEMANKEKHPYDLICLDIIMPNRDGHSVLKALRKLEQKAGVPIGKGVKVIMTTALADGDNVSGAFNTGCEGYIVKPIDTRKLLAEIQKLGLIE